MNAPANTNAIVITDSEMLSKYGVDLAQIEAVRAECAGKTFDTPSNYKDGVKALARARDTRVGIDKRRKELKADALEYGRRVDSVARELTSLISPIEDDLQAKKDASDEAKRIAKEAEERRKKEELEAKIRAEREAEEARLKAEREAKEKQLAEERAAFEAEKARLAEEQRVRDEAARVERERVEREQEAERQRIAAERTALEAEQKRIRDEAEAKARAERARMAEEQRRIDVQREAIEAEKRRIDQAENERIAREKAEKEAAERVERDRIEAEERRVAQLEQEAERQRRLETLKPDADKIHEFAAKLSEAILSGPELATEEANEFMREIVNVMLNETHRMERF